jgi:vacuolar-type H+-ATPase subunit I/STV1
MLSPHTRLLVLALVGLSVLLGLFFWRTQNVRKARGGRISPPKLAWLFYAIFLWFLLCPLVALDSVLHPGLRAVIGAFTACMWLRGLAELYMLYVSKNWRPPYGIGHDVLCILLVLGGLALTRHHWTGPLPPRDVWGLALVGLVLVSLFIEVLYAALFFQAVEGHTTGEDGIWFADEEQARFRRINRLTFALNVPLYLGLAGLLAVGLGVGT